MRIAIQMLQHFPERKAAAKLIKENDGLSAVAIEGMGVAAHSVNIGISVLFQNAPGFSNAGFAPEVSAFQLPEAIPILLLPKNLPGGVYIRKPVHCAGEPAQDICIGGVFLKHGKNLLGVLKPFSLFPDIIPVFLMASLGRFDMRAMKALLQRIKKNGVWRKQVEMGMRRALFADLITHTPVLKTGKGLQGGADDLMRKPVLLGVVEGQLILSAFCRGLISVLLNQASFLKLHKTRGLQKGNTKPFAFSLK